MFPDNTSPAHNHNHNINSQQQTCYFTYKPADHWSTETPIESPRLSSDIQPDPSNPFLAARPAYLPLSPPLHQQRMDVSKFMQFQTAAAHGSSNMSSRSSSSDSSRTSSDMGTPVIQDKSCSRCQTTHGSFIAYSLNSYYCTRCAKMTGYTG
jgi:ribosomal protein S27AE